MQWRHSILLEWKMLIDCFKYVMQWGLANFFVLTTFACASALDTVKKLIFFVYLSRLYPKQLSIMAMEKENRTNC